MGDLLTDEAVFGGAAAQHAARAATRIRVGVRPLRVLFFNEGNLGTYVLGHAQLERSLRGALRDGDGVEARFAELSPIPRLANAAASRPIEPLRRAELDMASLRWHLVQSLRARSQLGRRLAGWTPDVVHFYTPAVALLMGSHMRRVPFVLSMDTTVRDWSQMPAWRSSRPYGSALLGPSAALERRALERAALVLARTAWVRRSVEQHAPGVRVLEHHPGIDLGLYRPAEHEPRTRTRVLFVGSRFAAKGGEDLLAALDGELGRTVELDVVTPDPVEAREGVRVHRLAPGDERLLELQRQADVMCLPTKGDTNPWAILEAMACGTPVLASSVGGIPDMLDDGRAGVLVPPGDRAALREALLALAADRPRRRALGASARLRCEIHYDSQKQFQLLLGHLRSVA